MMSHDLTSVCVMMSHDLSFVCCVFQHSTVKIGPEDVHISYLPLAHMMERLIQVLYHPPLIQYLM